MAENKHAFRLRGTSMSRIDAFSDVVFGFALTLLVVSLEVPRTYGELMVVMKGFLPFALCFTILILIWHEHYTFFRRYNLHDGLTMVLNIVLLFVVLFYVYPLKFLFTLVTGQIHGAEADVIRPENVRPLMILYGLGAVTIYSLLGLLYFNALRQREHLKLNELEVLDTWHSISEQACIGGVALLSVTAACFLHEAGKAGFIYLLNAPLMTALGTWNGVKRRKLEERLDREEAMRVAAR